MQLNQDIVNIGAGEADNGLKVEATTENATATGKSVSFTLNEGAQDAGDVITVTVKGTDIGADTTASYTVKVGDTLELILGGLKAAITEQVGLTDKFTAEVVEGKLVITSNNTADTTFEVGAAVR